MLLVTGDRDAFQLVTDDVKVVTTKKGITDIVTYGPAEVLDRYGVTPAQVPDYLGLKGDTSDNIPGVPGVGEKTAAKLLQEWGSLDAVLANAESIPGKLGESLRANKDAALASRVVATIACDVPVDIDLAAVEFGGFDPHRVATAFAELRFTSLLDRVLALRGGVARSADAGGGVSAAAFVPSAADAGEPNASEPTSGVSASDVTSRRVPRGCLRVRSRGVRAPRRVGRCRRRVARRRDRRRRERFALR